MKAPLVTFPQLTKSISVKSKSKIMENQRVQGEVKMIERALGQNGRIILRPSGTEPVLRIMVEAKGKGECREYIDRMVNVIREAERDE